MATRQKRKKRMREKVDELMKDFKPSNYDFKTLRLGTNLKNLKLRTAKKGKIPPIGGDASDTGPRSISLQQAVVVLDSNAIIDSVNDTYRKQVQQILKKRDLEILLTETSLGESTRILNMDMKTLDRELKKIFGDRFKKIKTTVKTVQVSTTLSMKYKKFDLHHADSLIMAVAVENECGIITNDKNLKSSCKDYGLEVIDHRRVRLINPDKPKTAKTKVKPPRKKTWSLDEVLDNV